MAEKIIKCIQCDKQFSTVKILRRHMLESHPANPDDVVQFSCLCCDKKFTRAGNLQRHVHAMHNPNKVVAPPSSPKNANIATCALEMATVEEKTDNASKTHCCLTCGSKFRQLCHLKEHMLIHNGVKFSCAVCAKYFSRLRTWRSHMEKYHSWVGSSHSLDDDDDKDADTASCSLTSTESSTDSTSVSSGKIPYPYGDSHSPFDEGSVYEHGFCASAPHELQCESQFQCQSLLIKQHQQLLQAEPADVEFAFLRACESIYCSSQTDEEGDIAKLIPITQFTTLSHIDAMATIECEQDERGLVDFMPQSVALLLDSQETSRRMISLAASGSSN
jgi:hypothetical protein